MDNVIDFGVIILCPDKNKHSLHITHSSLVHKFCNPEIIAILPSNSSPFDFRDFKEYCDTYKGGESLSSLINTGFKKLKKEWVFIMIAGSRVKQFTERRLHQFAIKPTDVLYCVKNFNRDFLESQLSGTLINRNFFETTGGFQEISVEEAKKTWGYEAKGKGATFKGIVGFGII